MTCGGTFVCDSDILFTSPATSLPAPSLILSLSLPSSLPSELAGPVSSSSSSVALRGSPGSVPRRSRWWWRRARDRTKEQRSQISRPACVLLVAAASLSSDEGRRHDPLPHWIWRMKPHALDLASRLLDLRDGR
jgi:hypothetical protein